MAARRSLSPARTTAVAACAVSRPVVVKYSHKSPTRRPPSHGTRISSWPNATCGVHGHRGRDDAALPFPAQSFDLVVSRHPTIVLWTEIAPVLQPGGMYLSQQVGAGDPTLPSQTSRVPAHRQGTRPCSRPTDDHEVGWPVLPQPGGTAALLAQEGRTGFESLQR